MLLTAAAPRGDGRGGRRPWPPTPKRRSSGPPPSSSGGAGLLYRRLREDALALADLRRALSLGLPPAQGGPGPRGPRRHPSRAEARGRGGGRAASCPGTRSDERPCPSPPRRDAPRVRQARGRRRRGATSAGPRSRRRRGAAGPGPGVDRAEAIRGGDRRRSRAPPGADGESARVLLARGRLAAAQGNADLGHRVT